MSRYLVINADGRLYALKEEDAMEIFEIKSLVRFPAFEETPLEGIALLHGEATAVVNTSYLLNGEYSGENLKYAVAVGRDEPICAFTLNPAECYVLPTREISKVVRTDEEFCVKVFYTEKGVIHLVDVQKVQAFLANVINNLIGG